MNTFADYSRNVFDTYIQKELQNCKRIDIIWDVYRDSSLKECTWEKRGRGIRMKVDGHAKFPKNFQDFFHDGKNKQELFDFLSSNIISCSTEKNICVTLGKLTG